MCGGSSPRARGTPSKKEARRAQERFIPACAGNTPQEDSLVHRLPVHPRVRGEHYIVTIQPPKRSGSSPRARGTPIRRVGNHGVHRFIPACAGNTPDKPSGERDEAVHPRVRGEHSSMNPWAINMAGSSPRARGTRIYIFLSCWVHRFIPACAGNTQ